MYDATRVDSADVGCSDNGGAFSEMLADRRGRSSCRIIDTIPEPLINNLAVNYSGTALTSNVSSDFHSDEIV